MHVMYSPLKISLDGYANTLICGNCWQIALKQFAVLVEVKNLGQEEQPI